MYASVGSSNARGTIILLRPRLEIVIDDHTVDEDGRIVCINGVLRDKRITICNIYAPNTDSPEFFAKVIQTIENFPNRDLVLLGGTSI